MAATSRPKTQCADNKFGQDNGQWRETVKILGEELQRVHHFKYIGSSVGEIGGTTTKQFRESEPSVEKLEEVLWSVV